MILPAGNLLLQCACPALFSSETAQRSMNLDSALPRPHLPSMETEILDSASVVPTRYWHKLDDGRVQCDVCPRYCKLHEGQRCLCFVRGNHNGRIVLTTYGRSSGYCVDPIEKKPAASFSPRHPGPVVRHRRL